MKKGFGKKAQFFLLTAVVISAIVINLGIIANQARINKQPEHFYDYSYTVKKETGSVIDYNIYSNFDGLANLTNFVDLLAKDIRDKDPNLNYVFIYGDNSTVVLKNYGSDSVKVSLDDETETVEGASKKIISSIRYGPSAAFVPETLDTYEDDINSSENKWEKTYKSLPEGSYLNATIQGHNFIFPITQYKQVIFIIEKEANNESYIAAE